MFGRCHPVPSEILRASFEACAEPYQGRIPAFPVLSMLASPEQWAMKLAKHALVDFLRSKSAFACRASPAVFDVSVCSGGPAGENPSVTFTADEMAQSARALLRAWLATESGFLLRQQRDVLTNCPLAPLDTTHHLGTTFGRSA